MPGVMGGGRWGPQGARTYARRCCRPDAGGHICRVRNYMPGLMTMSHDCWGASGVPCIGSLAPMLLGAFGVSGLTTLGDAAVTLVNRQGSGRLPSPATAGEGESRWGCECIAAWLIIIASRSRCGHELNRSTGYGLK